MEEVLLVIHLLIAVGLIGFVMLQRSEGGALGIGGGSGSGNLFTSRGVGSGLTRGTAYLAAAFFVTSIILAILANRQNGSIFEGASPTVTEETAPAPVPELPKPQVPVTQ